MQPTSTVSLDWRTLLACALLISLPIVLALGLSFFGGAYSWDDGAITLAFGRTLFATGEFALNAESPRVEGSSTLLFALLNGAIISGLDLDFYNAIVGSRLLSAFFHGATSYLLMYALRAYLPARQAVFAALIYCLLPVHYAEIFNGMEMTAFAFLLVLYFHALHSQSQAAFAILPLLLLVRIEAGFYLLIALGLTAWASDAENRTRLLKHLGATVFLLFMLQVFRVLYFGSFLPNTVLAKMHEPYSFSDSRAFELKLLGFVDYLRLYIVPIMSISALLYLSYPKVRIRGEHLLVLAFGLFALLSGRNWGYDARMTLALLAPAVIGSAAAAHAFQQSRVQETSALPFSLLLLTLAGHTVGSLGSVALLSTALQTGSEFSRLATADASDLDPVDQYSYGFYGVTPENYRITGEVVERLADLLGLPVIKFAVPDVGGVGLCCNKIAILDTALLTNPFLAEEGYSAFDRYLEQTAPDVIETHEVWSEVTRIYDSPIFNARYTPAVFQNTLLFLRKDHADALVLQGEGTYVSFSTRDFHAVRYGVDVTNGLYPGAGGTFLNVE